MGRLCHDFDIHQIGLNVREAPPCAWTLHPCREPEDIYGFDELRLLLPVLKPDVVFLVQDLWIIPGYTEILAGSGIPVIAYVPLDGALARPEVVCGLLDVTHIVAYVPWARDQIRNAFAKLAETEPFTPPTLHVIPHAIDVTSFHPVQNARRQLFPDWPRAEEAFLVLNANQNRPRKQMDLTVEAFALFARDKPLSVRLYLHAAPCGYADLRTLAHLHGIADRLLLTEEQGISHPVVSSERLNLIYNACDIGVNTASGEGWGLVSFEHAATGAAQVVPAHSACRDLWQGAAELVETELNPATWQAPLRMSTVSVPGVAAAMERLYSDQLLRKTLGAAAQVNATSQTYGWPAVTQQWHRLFDQASTGGVP